MYFKPEAVEWKPGAAACLWVRLARVRGQANVLLCPQVLQRKLHPVHGHADNDSRALPPGNALSIIDPCMWRRWVQCVCRFLAITTQVLLLHYYGCVAYEESAAQRGGKSFALAACVFFRMARSSRQLFCFPESPKLVNLLNLLI